MKKIWIARRWGHRRAIFFGGSAARAGRCGHRPLRRRQKRGTDCHGAMRLAMTGFGECDGRPQGSPLRRDKGAVRAGRRGRRPLRRATRREYGLPRQSADWLAMTGFDNKIKRRTSKRPPFCIKLREKSEVFDDLHDLGADALLSLHGGGADMSGRLENVPVAHF